MSSAITSDPWLNVFSCDASVLSNSSSHRSAAPTVMYVPPSAVGSMSNGERRYRSSVISAAPASAYSTAGVSRPVR